MACNSAKNKVLLVCFMDKITKKLPDSPGVYFFKKGKTVLYIGKATSLRDRVRSYFGSPLLLTRGQAIVNMVKMATSVEYMATDSVLEALILESVLIKKHQPKYNSREKDDKSYFFVVISKEDYPRVFLLRGKDLINEGPTFVRKSDLRNVFGPFPRGGELKEALKIIRKIFPFRDRCVPNSGKECFESQIGLCPGVCVGKISKREYLYDVNNIKLLFEGRKIKLVKKLEKKMNLLAKELQFEKAGELKRQIFGLKHINDIALIKNKEMGSGDGGGEVFRIEAYDVSHLSNKNRVGVMVVLENGEIIKKEYRKFKIKNVEVFGDTNDLKEILDRRFYHEEWRLPDLLVVDGGVAQKNVSESVISNLSLKIPVVSVVKDEFHKPKKILGKGELVRKHEREILLANSEAHRFSVSFQRKIRSNFKK